MKNIILICLVMIIFCSLVSAQGSSPVPEDSESYVAYQDGNRTVYMVVNEVPSNLFIEEFELRLNETIKNLESQRASFFDYLSVVNIVLIIILFVLLLRKKKTAPPAIYR